LIESIVEIGKYVERMGKDKGILSCLYISVYFSNRIKGIENVYKV